jgi:hypothetical protein
MSQPIRQETAAREGKVIRLVLIFVLAQASAPWSQSTGVTSSSNCPSTGGDASSWYVQEVWHHVLPQDSPRSLIVISLSINTESKLILRARDGKRFELLRGTYEQPLLETLNQLARSCRLPSNPADAATLVPIHWETTEISSDTFAAEHRDFTAAFAEVLENAQRRYGTVLSQGGRLVLHNTEFRITYDNDGYEHAEAIVDDLGKAESKNDSMLTWIHHLQALSRQSLKTGR